MPIGKIITYCFAALAGLTVLTVAANVAGTLTSVANAPGRALQKTLQADNVITSYEWFFDTNAVNARLGQIASHRAILTETRDETVRSRLRIELAAMQQSCREMAERYNANSEKLNKGLFRDWRLVPSLNPTLCNERF